jgi:hypothetical protein
VVALVPERVKDPAPRHVAAARRAGETVQLVRSTVALSLFVLPTGLYLVLPLVVRIAPVLLPPTLIREGPGKFIALNLDRDRKDG